MIILGALVFGWGVLAKPRHQAPSTTTVDRGQPIADRVLAEDDD